MRNSITIRSTVTAILLLSAIVATDSIAETFRGIAKVDNASCSNDYSRIRDCHDNTLPEAPSIQVNALSKGAYDTDVVDFPEGKPTAGASYVLPHHRASNDGRLVLVPGTRPSLKIFRPENIADDFKVIGDGSKDFENLFSAEKSFLPIQLVHPVRSQLNEQPSSNTPTLLHSAVCDDSTSAWDTSSSNATGRNPRTCQANVHPDGDLYKEHEAVLVDGDCYDITIMVNAREDYSVSDRHWEMIANEFTVFVEKPKTASAGGDVRKNPLIYPRMTETVLPFYGFYDIHNAHKVPATSSSPERWNWDYSYAHARSLEMCFNNNQDRPRWCQHFDKMQTSADHGFVMDENANGRTDRNEYWDGTPGRHHLFEPSISADGRLIVLNGGPGLFYGYSEQACDVRAWSQLRPVTAMPWDTRINNKYPIALALKNEDGSFKPFRDSQGNAMYKPVYGQNYPMFEGAYPWIDREARNIFFSKVNDFRDGYQFRNTTEPCPAGTPDWRCGYNPALAGRKMSPDGRPGKGVSVIGAWTRGKIVQLDNRINMSDFGNIDPGDGFQFNADRMPSFEMPLFQGEPVNFQMKAAQAILSFENMFNNYNALSPRLPYDVVWTLSTDVSQNSEVIFDEYMADNAVIVAHMNSPFTSYDCGENDCPSFPADGFIPSNPKKSERFDGAGEADFRFRKTPLIQNASTLETSSSGGCPTGTYQSGEQCAFTSWSSRNSVYHFYVPSTETIYVGDYRWIKWPRISCPSNTQHIGDWSRGLRCGVEIPQSTDAQAFFVSGNQLVTLPEAGELAVPSTLSLLGGSHVQPLALGGVIGKGLWLDGANDHLEARFSAVNTKDWFAGVWLDNRSQDSVARTIFTWSDGSRIALANNKIVAVQNGTSEEKSIAINKIGLRNENYFHFGVKSILNNSKRELYFYVNGTRLPQSLSFTESDGSFSLSKPLADRRSAFWLGDPGNNGDKLPTFKGWADELRVYAITDRERPNDSYFEESICNLAFGSMVEVKDKDQYTSNSTLRKLYNKAIAFGLIREDSSSRSFTPTIGLSPVGSGVGVCEQMRIASHQEPADFAPQAPANAICADRVHRNAHPQLADRCMRKRLHKIEKLPLVADAQRPDFSTTPFCLSCHSDTNSLEELRISALTEGVHARFRDERRQPMDVPAILTGCTPSTTPFNGGCYSEELPLILDRLFDQSEKILPN